MSVIVIDAALKAKLLAAGGTAELRDEAGNRIGRFLRWEEPAPSGRAELNLSDEELTRRLAPDAKTYTTAEVLDHLRGLR
jgi:hypothetical protein